MCGRFVQKENVGAYFRELGAQGELFGWHDAAPMERYNIAPTTRTHLFQPTEKGLSVEAVRWGWAPFWAKGKRPAPINARVETVATRKFFKGIWPDGRVLVPADGWYEWVKDPNDPKKKQPYFIRLKSQAPMFFAGLAKITPGLEPGEDDGFVIITDASDAGMVDIHDRRPLVLTPESAREWIEMDLPAHRAEEIAKTECRPVDDFEWYPVGRAVGNVRNQGPELIEPIS